MTRHASSRGWSGVGGGASTVVAPPDRFRGTSNQVCGLWPFAVGSGAPTVGVPLGPHLRTGAAVCGDPITLFERARLISNPSVAIWSQPGLGKSTLVRRMVTGLADRGVHAMVLGDLRPDYVALVERLGGQVIRLGQGRGQLNVLDTTMIRREAARLTGRARDELLADAAARRAAAVKALIGIVRREQPTDREENILDRALAVLDEKMAEEPVLADLLQVLKEAPATVRAVSGDQGDDQKYLERIENLEASLVSLTSGLGRLGDVFAGRTSVQMRHDRPVAFDISSIPDLQDDLQAAVLVLCWSTGFATVDLAQRLADAGLERRRHYLVVLDELWRVLRSGSGMVDRIDHLTRLNRASGVGQALVFHSLNDLKALNDIDRRKAIGFAEKAGFTVLGGLPSAEMQLVGETVGLSQAEADLVTGWTSPPSFDPDGDAPPPGRGHFMMKIGRRPGVPLKVSLTAGELAVNETNHLWGT